MKYMVTHKNLIICYLKIQSQTQQTIIPKMDTKKTEDKISFLQCKYGM